jgi:4-hydroxy-tetrahydrodipicolinate synthase
MFHGSITALVTPFRDGAVDETAFVALVERQIAAGTHGLVPVGTTGETPTLSHAEHRRVVELCVQTARGRVPVIAGAGSNATAEAIELAHHAKTIGADAALIVAPYYNKPSQEGLFAHFKAINDAVQIPLFVYNIPGRSVVDIRPETMARIAELPNVVGLKDSAGDPSRTQAHRALCGDDFVVLCGDDNLALGFAAYGAAGCVSVVANITPDLCAHMQTALAVSDYARARHFNDLMAPLQRACFLEPNPVPTKFALSQMGLCAPDVRLPLVEPTDATKDAMRAALAHAGVSVNA